MGALDRPDEHILYAFNHHNFESRDKNTTILQTLNYILESLVARANILMFCIFSIIFCVSIMFYARAGDEHVKNIYVQQMVISEGNWDKQCIIQPHSEILRENKNSR